MTFLNLTPHTIAIYKEGDVDTIKPFGFYPRVVLDQEELTKVDGVPIIKRQAVETLHLPAPQEGIYYIVSSMVRMANPNRKDLVSPGSPIKDERGQLIGCTNFVAN